MTHDDGVPDQTVAVSVSSGVVANVTIALSHLKQIGHATVALPEAIGKWSLTSLREKNRRVAIASHGSTSRVTGILE